MRNLSSMNTIMVGTVVFALGVVGNVRSARADSSSWGTAVGFPDGDNATWWCRATSINTGFGGRQSLTTSLQRVASDGTAGPYVANLLLTQRARAQCFATPSLTGSSVIVTSAWSSDFTSDQVTTPSCPASRPYVGFPRCQESSIFNWYVYAGSPCGDGISAVGTAFRMGQLTGSVPQFPWLPLYNNTGIFGSVGGTDLGNIFFNQGKMYFAFGDSFSGGVGSALWRSNTLFSSSDFDPTNGINFDGYEFDLWTPNVAKELIHGAHDPEDVGEVTAIPSGSFAITEANGDNYRYMWFFSAHGWDPGLETNYSSIAYSKNGGAWSKLAADSRPIWAPDSQFGLGGVWYDRGTGWLYFFGTQAQMPVSDSAVRVAKVQAKHAFITDRTKYWYWTGATWEQDTDGDMLESLPATYDASADLISPSRHPRGELSVAYNSYANRFTMMFLNTSSANVELWQSPGVTGPWTAVSTGSALPNSVNAPGGYAPLMDEIYMTDRGHGVYFLYSQWTPIYNVAQWQVAVERNTATWCVP